MDSGERAVLHEKYIERSVIENAAKCHIFYVLGFHMHPNGLITNIFVRKMDLFKNVHICSIYLFLKKPGKCSHLVLVIAVRLLTRGKAPRMKGIKILHLLKIFKCTEGPVQIVM